MNSRRIRVTFDADSVHAVHQDWLHEVRQRVGIGELDPQPYWEIDEVSCKVAEKLGNCIYVHARSSRRQGEELFYYVWFDVLEEFDLKNSSMEFDLESSLWISMQEPDTTMVPSSEWGITRSIGCTTRSPK